MSLNSKIKKKKINLLIQKQGLFCCYCETPLQKINITNMSRSETPPDAMTLEHLRRREDGGGDEEDNLALACFFCNTGRGSVDWMTYKSYRMGELHG